MLQQFGFTQYESQVYEALITSEEPLDATAIVKRSGVPRSKVYEVLHRMAEKGMILETNIEKKRLYTALPIESAIGRLKAEFNSSIEELRSQQTKVKQVDDRVWTLKDNQSIKSLLKELLTKANTSIFISGWADDLIHYLPILEDKFHAGVEVQIHTIGAISTVIPNVSTLIPDTQHGRLERSRNVIIDNEEILFAGIEEDNWQAIRTQSSPLVKFFSEFFYHDVALTEITRKYKDTIMEDAEIQEALMKLRY